MINLNLIPFLQSLTPITLQYSSIHVLSLPRSSLLDLSIESAISKANLKSFRLYYRKLSAIKEECENPSGTICLNFVKKIT